MDVVPGTFDCVSAAVQTGSDNQLGCVKEMTNRAFVARRIAVLAGTGIQTGSWEPIFAAFRKLGCPGVVCPDTANTALATIVQNRRLGHASMADGAPTPSQESVDRAYRGVVDRIRNELRTAQKEGRISLRADFEETWNRVIGGAAEPKTTQLTIFTTNWDEVLIRKMQDSWHSAPQAPEHYHLHGGLGADTELLLPSETAIEPYRPRHRSEAQSILRRRKALVKALVEADLVVIWGLGLSPLDAELMQAIFMGLYAARGPQKQVRIVNPDHRSVAQRLMALKTSDLTADALPVLTGWSSGEFCEYQWPTLSSSE